MWIGAQTGGYPQKGFVSFGVSYQRWVLENAGEPDQIVFPVAIFYPVRPDLYLNISSSPAMTRYENIKMTGLSDTYVGVTYVLPGERIMLNAGLGTPTGKTELTSDEFFLTQILSENAFQFRLPSYGQGFHAKVGVGFAYPVSEKLVLGAGANYVYKLAFNPIKDQDIEYQPGPETGIYLGLGIRLAENVQMNLDGVYTIYGADKSGDVITFASGDKLLFNATVLGRLGNTTLFTAARWRQKGKNELGITLMPETKNSNGDQIELLVQWQFMERGPLMMQLLGDGRFYSKNGYDDRGATIYGGGIGIQYKFSPSVAFRLNVKGYTGTYLSIVDTSISGMDVFSQVQIGL